MRAQIYNILANTPNRSITALRLSIVILIFFHGSLIFSDQISVNYESWIKEVTGKEISRVGNGILKVGSTINQVLSNLGVFNAGRSLSVRTLTSLLFLLALLLTLNCLVILNPNWISWIALSKPTSKGKIFLRPAFKKFIQITYNYYDIFFVFCWMLACGTFSCRWILVRKEEEQFSNVLSSSFYFAYIENQ